MDGRLDSLEGVDNFRDFGGYATAGGRRIRPGRLFRSAHHGQATPADLAAIAALDIAVIVDLRRGEERQRTPSRRHDGFAARLIENEGNEAVSDPFVEFIKTSDASEQAFRDYMLGYYRNAPLDERHLDLFSRYFRALGEAEGPVLIHCTAGKDRTGLLAALTHHLAGVHRDDLLADYLLTNTVASFDRRLPAVAQMIVDLLRSNAHRRGRAHRGVRRCRLSRRGVRRDRGRARRTGRLSSKTSWASMRAYARRWKTACSSEAGF